MSNYEHIFESAMDYMARGKGFDDFKEDKSVQNNVKPLFANSEDKYDLLDCVWCIAQYVSCYYFESDKDCNTCAWQKMPECFCDICVYGPKTKDCYLPN